ncbi:glycosyltransferase family 39 protein [Dyella sp. A6]|uniref:ArnT family glycosyltransferase n=1 Tax=Dyella aluminiiresistens TaxID=3069105 RepID=UPI002E7A8014|nr:glycosyltransferase family 39 protein [Dyella sp. A6]
MTHTNDDRPTRSDSTDTANLSGGRGNASARSTRARRIGLACIWLGLLLAVLGFSFQGTRSLWNTDEGRYVDNALQMVDSGNYLVPAYNDLQPNYTKPPLALWAIAGSVHIFGHNTFAVRAPSALAFLLTALLLCAMGRMMIPERPWLAGLIYACSFAPFIAANVVSTDDMLTLCEALAMWGFMRACFTDDERSQRVGVHVMWLGFGLAFLAKGPPGLLPLLPAAVFVARRDGIPALRRYVPWTGLALFGLAGLSWYVVIIVRDPSLLVYFLRYEVYERIFTATQGRNPQWYGWLVVYGPVLVLGSLPWWPMLLAPMKSAVLPASWRRWWDQPSATLFLALWFVLPLLVFCMARSRLPVYALPLFLPLALIIGRALRARFDLASGRQWLALGIWVALLLTIKGATGIYVHPHLDNRLMAHQLTRMTGQKAFSAVAFVEATDSGVSTSEHTPWGMRLYLDKPLYAVAWKQASAAALLCRLSERHPSLLVVLDQSIGKARALARMAQSSCMPQRHLDLGTWASSDLLLFQQETGATGTHTSGKPE